MSKRLIRIASKNILTELGTTSEGLELNAISRSGNTCFGKLISVTSDFLTILDTRQHKHKFALSDIFEVVYDEKSKF
ncbi:hypothetical protein SAMN04487995_5888 [Dyadobacter koreensis]|uniref:Uncharacterized protein n=1 Tax=Dyadobacter koreensis TaxID=408657 RepID=A0A1H7B1R9_9BACT|nr:hypothetical protein [Dyadobacter koreensis]SEJ68342.1 hypothetical protein SAMN04487995_5888 [Dyadobacter koreensis]